MSPSSTKETNNEQDDEDGEQQRHEHLLGCKSIPRLNLRTRRKEKQMPEKRLCPLCGDPANLNKSSKLTIESLLAERDIYRELVNNTSIHLAELKAEVERLTKMLDVCAVTHDHNVKLKAEVESLKAHDLSKWRFKVHIVDREEERSGPYNYVDLSVDDIGYADKGMVFSSDEPLVRLSRLQSSEAEVERLKAHTWEQERAAVVAWLRLEPSYQNRPWAVITADIERGKHEESTRK